MRTIGAIGLGLTVLFTGQGALAQQTKGQGNPLQKLIQLDANNDRVIESAEVPEEGKAAFEKLLERGDANKDGKLQVEEIRALGDKIREQAGPGAMIERLKAMDADNDNKVSRDEFKGRPEMFERVDANKDGFIDKEEATRALRAMGGAVTAGPMLERLKAMDANNDNKVSRDEFKGQPEMFDRLDMNKDGFIDKEDTPQAPRSPAAGTPAAAGPMLERLKAMDANNDGKVSRDEFKGRPEMFDRLDTNKDGFVDKEDAPQAPRNPVAGAPAGAGPLVERLKAMDTNNDGKISRDEFKGRPAIFDRLDKDNDGSLTPEELRAGRPGGVSPVKARARAAVAAKRAKVR